MSLESWSKDLLPTKWSRRFAVATVLASGSAYSLPSLLPQPLLPSSPVQLFLTRLVLLLLVACVGLLIVLCLVVRAYHTQAVAHQSEMQATQHAHAQELESRSNANLHRPLNYHALHHNQP
jgi:hypothetical protein